jgi:hypothetical protein
MVAAQRLDERSEVGERGVSLKAGVQVRVAV